MFVPVCAKESAVQMCYWQQDLKVLGDKITPSSIQPCPYFPHQPSQITLIHNPSIVPNMVTEKEAERGVHIYSAKEMLENLLEGPYFKDPHSDLDLYIHSIILFPQHPSVAKKPYHCVTDGIPSQA